MDEIAYIPVSEMLAIEAFDEDTVTNLELEPETFTYAGFGS